MNLGDLKSSDWQKLQAIADRFEADWQFRSTGEKPPDLNDYLPPAGDGLRLLALHELIKTDLEIRYRRGQPTALEDYLKTFPELGPKDQLPAPLIFEEFRVRQTHGDRPALESYQGRFPQQFPELKTLVTERPFETLAAPADKTPADSRDDTQRAPGPSRAVPSMSDFLSGYKWVKKIGSGGFGEVWSAEAPGGVPVAIKKIFRPIDHAESLREQESLELIKRLRHPFLLATQAFEQKEDRLFIVMELADGSLRDRVSELRKAGIDNIPLPELVTYFREAADALDYLHGEKVLHRDVKPDNILTLKRHTKLADFGLARLLDNQGLVSASGSGTPAYMAPEVWRGKVCEQSDQYSLALAYVELRRGKRAFESRDMMEIMLDHMERPPQVDGLTEPEQEVLRKALAKDPKERYASCREFVQSLERALGPALGRGDDSFVQLTIQAPRSSPQTGEMLGRATENQLAGATLAAGALQPSAGPGPTGQPGRQATGWREGRAARTAAAAAPPPRFGRRLAVGGVVLLTCGLAAAFAAWKTWAGGKPGAALTEASAEVSYLPPNCVKAEGAEVVTVEDKKYYSKIDFLLPDRTPVRFILIRKRRVSDPETFYIMEDKVSVGLFKKFADANTAAVSDDRWLQGALANGQPTKNGNPRHPVMNVVVEDAWRFAYWLKGDLPSADQWDKASGAYEEKGREGPFDMSVPDDAGVAVDRGDAGPVEMAEPGKPIKDMSPLGPRYMAGNGLEWTRDVAYNLFTKRVPLSAEDKTRLGKASNITCRVHLRGKNYLEKEPYRYSERNKETQDYLNTTPWTSFRVVLEIPQ